MLHPAVERLHELVSGEGAPGALEGFGEDRVQRLSDDRARESLSFVELPGRVRRGFLRFSRCVNKTIDLLVHPRSLHLATPSGYGPEAPTIIGRVVGERRRG